MRWITDERTEHKFKRAGVDYEMKRIKFSEIDRTRSRKNQARMIGQVINDENMLAIAIQMEANSPIPAIVVCKHGKKYTVIDGNHRVEAFETANFDGKTEFLDAYVIEGDDDQIELLTRSWNRSNGLGQKDEEALLQINQILEHSPNATIAQLSEMFGVSRNRVSEQKKLFEIEKLLQQRFKRTKFNQGHLRALRTLENNHNVMFKAAQAIQEWDLTNEKAEEMVRHTKTKRTEKQKMDAVVDFVSGLVPAKRKVSSGATAPKKRKFMDLANSLRILLMENPSRDHLHLNREDDYLHAKGLFDAVIENGRPIFKDKQTTNGSHRRTTRKKKA